MSDISLVRKIFTNKSTIGELIFDDLKLFTLEDSARRIKIDGETCIPSGSYGIEIRQSAHYKKPMPFLINVPFYQGIMIHTGNTDLDSRGCILIGLSHKADFIGESKKAFDLLYPRIQLALKSGPLKIKIAGGISQEEFNRKVP